MATYCACLKYKLKHRQRDKNIAGSFLFVWNSMNETPLMLVCVWSMWEEMMVEETKTSWEICIHQMRRNRDGERRYKDQDKRKSEQDSYRDTETIYFVCALGWLVCSTWSPVQTVHKYRKEALLLTNIKEYVHNDLTYFRANNVLLKIMTEQIKRILKPHILFWRGKTAFGPEISIFA